MPNPDRLGSSAFVKTFATIDADTNLLTVQGADGVALGVPPRWFSVGTAGDIVVDTAGGAVGQTITCVTGLRYDVQVTKVTDTGTTAAKITFYW